MRARANHATALSRLLSRLPTIKHHQQPNDGGMLSSSDDEASPKLFLSCSSCKASTRVCYSLCPVR